LCYRQTSGSATPGGCEEDASHDLPACGLYAAVDSVRAVAELIPLTVPEVHRLLWGVVWRALPAVDQVLAWSTWRRHHQALAKHCHYKRREGVWP